MFAIARHAQAGQADTPEGNGTEPPDGMPLLSAVQMILYRAAEAQKVNPAILLALAEIESSFVPTKINPSDPSYGLGQIQTFWIPALGLGPEEGAKERLLDPEFNARAMALIVDYFQRRGYQFPEQADVYNVGETKYRRGIRSDTYRRKFEKAFRRWEEKLA